MTKTITSVYIEAAVLERAKRAGINISSFLESRLMEHLSESSWAKAQSMKRAEALIEEEIKVFLDETDGEYTNFIDGRLDFINRKLGVAMTKNEFIARIIETKDRLEGEKDGND